MKLLAIDTSSNACSVALKLEDEVMDRHVVEPRAHTKILMPMITELLSAAGTEVSALDAIVLGNGPGSFIGMRIGASVVQGLAYGSGLSIVPVSSLAAVAAEVLESQDQHPVAVAQDAHMGEVYVGLFEAGHDGVPVPLADEVIVGASEQIECDRPFVAAGAGWARYPQLAEANRAAIAGQVAVEFPHSRHLLRLGAADYQAGSAISPERLKPSYLRSKVAEKPSARH